VRLSWQEYRGVFEKGGRDSLDIVKINRNINGDPCRLKRGKVAIQPGDRVEGLIVGP
jgi:hypothetical protein